MRILFLILFMMIIPLVCQSSIQHDAKTFAIYTKEFQKIGYLQNDKIYDNQWNYVGFIRREK
jgi:hypothetical protein